MLTNIINIVAIIFCILFIIGLIGGFIIIIDLAIIIIKIVYKDLQELIKQ